MNNLLLGEERLIFTSWSNLSKTIYFFYSFDAQIFTTAHERILQTLFKDTK